VSPRPDLREEAGDSRRPGEGLVPRLWIDTDIALGASAGDVDDGFALAALLGAARSGRAEILGISTVSGNADAETAARCARALAVAARSDVPVLSGAGSAEAGAAARAIAALPHGARIVALGPLSNVAAAAAIDPGLPGRAALSVVGGNLASRGFLPPFWPHEFNLARDRASARRVLAAPWRELLFHPLDVVSRLRCGKEHLEEVSRAGAVGAALARDSRRWLARTRRIPGRSDFAIWDLPAALAAAGVLPVVSLPRTFPRVQRAFAGIPDPALAVTSFDAGVAWRAFLDLVRALAD
jgi:inosine-uridine nucleoside N-ribohydrolase